MTKPLKPFASIDEQIHVLAARGLTIKQDAAKQWLQNVGYYRLSGYWYPFREMSGQKQRLDNFIAGTSLDEVVRLYEFDRKLRTLIHDGIERVEVALRSHVSYHLGSQGPIEYQNDLIFRPSFDHAGWIAMARARAARARRHSEPVRHLEARYDGTLPIWVLTEVLDFSDVSRLYDGLFAKDQWAIAEKLGILVNDDKLSPNQRTKVRKSHPLARWLEQMTVVRNTCAHHSRVWNRSFAPVSTAAVRTIDELRSLPLGQSERLYGALLVIGYFLQEVSPGSTWMSKVRNLIEDSFAKIPGRVEGEMGFPEHWREEQLWAPPTPDGRA